MPYDIHCKVFKKRLIEPTPSANNNLQWHVFGLRDPEQRTFINMRVIKIQTN